MSQSRHVPGAPVLLWPSTPWFIATVISGALGALSVHGASPTPIEDPFVRNRPLDVRLIIPAEGLRSLRSQSRTWVEASWTEGRQSPVRVGVRVKGRTGSFRPIDDRPSLTVDFDRFSPGQSWQGLRRLHLNNSVEDPSFQHERVGAHLFQVAGIPAPRVTHGIVTLNGHRLGLYVIKEGFTPDFLARHFAATHGTLYEPEPGPGCDVDGPMSINFGPPNRAALHRLAAVAAEPEPNRRWRQLGEVLDRDQFITFLALETLLGHRDGYGQARNNYRLYHDPATDRFHFLPSGLDRLFGRTNAVLHPRFAGLMARAVVTTDAGYAAYTIRLGSLFTNLLQSPAWLQEIPARATTLETPLTRTEVRDLRAATANLIDRIRGRLAFVEATLARPLAPSLRFSNNVAAVTGWRPIDPPAQGRLDQTESPGTLQLRIVAGPRTTASWQATCRLAPGRYAFEAQSRTHQVLPLPFGRHQGASLAVNRQGTPADVWLKGDTDWTTLRVEFEVTADEPHVELTCTLRASSGEAWFAHPQLRRLGSPQLSR